MIGKSINMEQKNNSKYMPNYFGWPGNIWIFSDPHFNHYNILRFERPFATMEEHNAAIIDGINSKVAVGDTLICLGDLGFGWESEIAKIKCETKVLILGNHDKQNKSAYYQYFNYVFDGPVFVNKFMVLSHEPWPGCGEYCFNIHGHLHNAYLDLENYVNANICQLGYVPLKAMDIYRKNDKLKRNDERFLTEWYAPHYYFPNSDKGMPDAPIKGHKLIPGFEKVPEIIRNENMSRKVSLKLRDIAWEKYDEGDDLATFISKEFDRILKTE